jgi:acetate kinase
MSEPGPVLVLNCGSSSVKLALVDPTSGERRVTGLAERVGSDDAVVRLRRGEDEERSTPDDTSARGALTHLLGELAEEERDGLVGVGHRVVHGGDRFSASVAVDDATLAELHELSDLAPLHMPANLLGIEAAREQLPGLVQVAVFDTAFHQTMPPVAYRYAVPAAWYDDLQVRRYGFHGTSHRFVSARAAELLGRPLDELRMVTLHLGNGCSATAVRGGESVDTTMGLTPLEGLVMGTRSGDVDPGLLGHVAERLDLDVHEVVGLLNQRSGLLGLSGISNDMRTVCEAAASGSEPARLAVDVFCYRAAKSVGALAVALGGLDAVVFTGGIGEHSEEVRRGVLAHLGVLGLHEDPDANAVDGRHTDGRVSRPGAVTALVVPTDEELLIARDTVELAR